MDEFDMATAPIHADQITGSGDFNLALKHLNEHWFFEPHITPLDGSSDN